jgi:outer membrane biogenesis lipoprotein LolB
MRCRHSGLGLTILLVTNVPACASNEQGVSSRRVPDRAKNQLWEQSANSVRGHNAYAVMGRAEYKRASDKCALIR